MPRAGVAAESPAPQPGVDVPDRRGRTGLDRVGRDLDRNPRVRVRDVRVLTSNWYVTRATTFDFQHADGSWTLEERETYDRGDGATILLYDREARTVLLTRQFRFPVYVNEHPDGMLIETAAGLLDDDDPETAIRREAEEETGHVVGEVQHVFDVYMSPGSVTERLHFFAAPYVRGSVAPGSRRGLADEGEDIEVLELDLDDALDRIGADIVDAKTIMLLQWAALRGPFRVRTPPATA
ncbi:NUDIX domain-containing protein [Agromyces binzhouensis]|uniref:NUDIX domain-containing protein n=2 Tax=Agromyces binzhouensis TaxID=1817495 RepID=A0A4Q2JV31_9MICO|nr:NUDIX domain-containing protein [Agromyces binzhouensis]